MHGPPTLASPAREETLRPVRLARLIYFPSRRSKVNHAMMPESSDRAAVT